MIRFVSRGVAKASFMFLLMPLLVSAEWVSDTREMMGTRIHIELWAEGSETGEPLINRAMNEIQRIDWLMNPLNEQSELYRINKLATANPIDISSELFWIINKSLYYSRLSNGAFDISFSTVGQHYDYRKGRSPSPETLEQYRSQINYQAIKLNNEDKTIFLAEPDMHLDLGGIAKGYAVDRAVHILLEGGVESAIVTAGGDSRIIGTKHKRPWHIGIKHPRKESANAVVIPLENTAISTSGDYERFYIEEGVRFHHIISPVTGSSVDHVQSVSVLAPRAVDSDALSTTVFILGVKRGLDLVNQLQGVDAIIIDDKGSLHYSDELLMTAQ